ncbi:MAG TPA: hypothetical protein VHR16_08120, partial [Candidatus Limnocylindrales bacterium]|nr:hypothetical protein [Candidatus Limnocylindrales bacterium]
MGSPRRDGCLARDARRAGAGRRGDARLTIAGLGPDVLAILFGLVGLVWGFVADRISARWPAHEDGSVRAIDWRTPVVMAIGALFLYALPGRYSDAGTLALFGAWFLVLQLLLATDLDQRLLPDVITLPMIPVTFVIAALGWSPLVLSGDFILAIVA